MAIGFGASPFGGYAYGLWYAPPTSIDPGPTAGAAFMDPDGDFECDGAGDLVKTTHTAQRALLLLRTELGSIWFDRELGLGRSEAVTASWENRMRRAVEKALRPMVDDSTIRILNIGITRPFPSRSSVVVTYLVLATGEQEIASI